MKNSQDSLETDLVGTDGNTEGTERVREKGTEFDEEEGTES